MLCHGKLAPVPAAESQNYLGCNALPVTSLAMYFGGTPVMLCLPYTVLQVYLLVLAFAALHSLLRGWKERESDFLVWLLRQYYPVLLPCLLYGE